MSLQALAHSAHIHMKRKKDTIKTFQNAKNDDDDDDDREFSFF